MTRQQSPAILRWGKACERCLRRGRDLVRGRMAASRLVTRARSTDAAALASALAGGPPLDVVILAADAGPGSAVDARHVAAAWEAGLVRPGRVWIATDRGPRLGAAGVGAPSAGPGRVRRAAVLPRLREAVGLCGAEHVVLAEATTTPEPDALAWMTAVLRDAPGLVAVYGDERVVTAGRGPQDRAPVETIHHQPDFSWIYLLSRNYLGGAVLYRADRLLAAIDRLLARNAAATHRRDVLHAIALEALRDRDRDEVAHVPHPLSRRPAADPPAADAGGDVVALALEAAGVAATVGRHPAVADLRRIELRPATRPHVSIIIPTRDGSELVRTCLRDLRATAGYEAHDVTVIDHDSTEPELAALLAEEERSGGARRLPHHGPFNYAAMNNAAVAATTGSLLLFLNNDVAGFSPRWLEQMVATFELDRRIGAVGCRLFYPDGDIQHAGVVLNAKRMCQHAHYGWRGDASGYHGRIHALQQFSAVTAALMMVRRDAFAAVGGFDAGFPDDYNDVDLCLRLGAAGYRIAYNPVVAATHWEGRTRRVKETGREVFRERWRHAFARDPWYHPHLGTADFRPDALAGLWRERKIVALAELASRVPPASVGWPAARQPAASPLPLRRRSA